MKKFIVLFFLSISIVFGDVLTEAVIINKDTIYMRALTETQLLFGEPFTTVMFDKEYLSFDISKVCEDHGVICKSNERAYYSSLDTTVAVFLGEFSIKLFGRYRPCFSRLDTVNCYPSYPWEEAKSQNLGAILKEEFLNLQEWGVIEISKDSATALIERIITDMKMGLKKYDKDSISIYANDSTIGDLYGARYFHSFVCDADTVICVEPLKPSFPVYNPNDFVIKINKTNSLNKSIFRTSKNTFAFSGEQHFYLYDLNGVLLKSGYAKNVRVEKFPVILKLNNGASFLLK